MDTLRSATLTLALLALACGDGSMPPRDSAAADTATGPCAFDPTFEAGGEGHADPLRAGAGEARAGRVRADQLPQHATGLLVWEGGDFVLANARVAMVIEDADASDLYDPWGGRPVGVARVEAGALIEPADFGEILLLTGRYSVMTSRVTVLADGSDGGDAIVRAEGELRPTPFFEEITRPIITGDFDGIATAIDYVLAPDADHVDVHVTHRSTRDGAVRALTTMHGFMFTPRMPPFAPGLGFDTENRDLPYSGFIDERGTSYAYSSPGQTLGAGLSVSGFVSNFTRPTVVASCGESTRHHARIIIGGPDLDGLLAAVARTEGTALRAIAGVVRDASGAAVEGARVHAEDSSGGYLTRARTDAAGAYTLHVPEGMPVRLSVFRPGDRVVGPVDVAAAESARDLVLGAGGSIHVTATDAASAAPLPVRVQLLPVSGDAGRPPSRFGEPAIPSGRIQVDYAIAGDTTLRAPAGEVRVVVSRGFEYELLDEVVTVAEGATVEVVAALERVIDTAGVQCADFHIHTRRSNDSGDDERLKIASAVADGLEIPIRTDHEYVDAFQDVIEDMGLAAWAFGVTGIEMTSMEVWGHMNVLPLVPDPSAVNAGAPRWQRYPMPDQPDEPVTVLEPPVVFDEVRARPEAPLIVINHPRGGANYFDYAGYDPITGAVARPEAWDEAFTAVEVFNDSDWVSSRDRTVRDWLSFLDAGRRVFAVGSSDSHSISGSPVGYARTCLALGTDDPRMLTPNMVRDAAATGHMTVTGGIFVDARAGTAGPGDEAAGLGATTDLAVRVQAASWIDVDRLEIVVDGAVAHELDILPADADPLVPTTRLTRDFPVDVASGGSYVIVAAYGDAALDPVHARRVPFGVTNPIFLRR